MVLIVAGGVAVRAGVVIKASDVLEQGFKITDILFDKTGSLTKADLHVASEVILSDRTTHDEALSIVKHLVKNDNHPVSKAVAAYIRDHSTVTNSVQRIKAVPSSGIQAEWDGHVVKAGSPFWLEIQSNHLLQTQQDYADLSNHGFQFRLSDEYEKLKRIVKRYTSISPWH
ncbi:hypothetical protein LTR95_003471 [Oleoguttula sp. CCFEE 5521]